MFHFYCSWNNIFCDTCAIFALFHARKAREKIDRFPNDGRKMQTWAKTEKMARARAPKSFFPALQKTHVLRPQFNLISYIYLWFPEVITYVCSPAFSP